MYILSDCKITMNQLRQRTCFIYWLIHEYMRSICGSHYPLEIVQIIVSIFWATFKVKISCGDEHNILLFDNDIYTWGYNRHGQLGLNHNNVVLCPHKINLDVKTIDINCGGFCSMILTLDFEVYMWGQNNWGQ